jgi:hypothetical protein
MARKSESYLVNKKYLGDEPADTGIALTVSQYGQCLNWYNYMCTIEDAREYISDYLVSKMRNDDIQILGKVSDMWITTSAAWLCRMTMRGLILPVEHVNVLIDCKIKDILMRAPVKVEAVAEVNKPSVRDRMKDKGSDIIGDIESLIDSGKNFSLYSWLQQNSVPALYVPMIVNYYTPWRDELGEAVEGTDPDLKEAYSYMTRKQLKLRHQFFVTLIDDALRYGGNVKKDRKPRKKKFISVDKKLKNFKYQKTDNELKITSISPEKVIGAQEVWAVNTRYKTLTVYRAIDRGGLQVKGTTIINFDEKTSMTKRTGRKVEEYINKVLTLNKIQLRKLMDELKYDAPMAARTSDNTVLLRMS